MMPKRMFLPEFMLCRTFSVNVHVGKSGVFHKDKQFYVHCKLGKTRRRPPVSISADSPGLRSTGAAMALAVPSGASAGFDGSAFLPGSVCKRLFFKVFWLLEDLAVDDFEVMHRFAGV
ncbi:hypothetical protein [Massilia antarctica]|uniref:hypothetical protein n=1 Tax=Massilia antarctica TaxID=2765360 RepID=UPI00226E1382|nr:hypothetical protein [Massilia sp. H27-R4]MCY0912161.1 hypothetical protein [Massilia sp. H27-R4]